MSAAERHSWNRAFTARFYLGLGLLAAGLPASSRPAPAQEPARHVVEIRDMAFQPSQLRVAPGDTVVWINRDIVPHTATLPGSGGWDSGILAPGDSAQYVPPTTGRVLYTCRLHPTMRARLVVAAEPRRRADP